MDFTWSDEQQELRQSIERFSREQLNRDLGSRESAGEFDLDGWKLCAEMGIQGLNVSAEIGGTGHDVLTTVGVLESLGRGCKDNGLLFSLGAHMWTVQTPLIHFGTEDQRDRYLSRLVAGELIGGNAMSEPDSGSDAYSLKTVAVRKEDRYILNGSKLFVTNGPIADLLVVFATVNASSGKDGVTAFLVETDTPGLSISNPVKKMGLNTSPMAELFLDHCEVPERNRLGPEGSGQALFTDSMTWERSCILAPAVGSMDRLLSDSLEYARNRKQFGEPIISFQLIASKLVEMKLRLESSRSLLYQAAWKRSQGRSIYLEAALAKLSISENWVAMAQDALQIHGGYGYMAETGIEMQLRDAIGSKLYSGTSEIQRVIAANMLQVG